MYVCMHEYMYLCNTPFIMWLGNTDCLDPLRTWITWSSFTLGVIRDHHPTKDWTMEHTLYNMWIFIYIYHMCTIIIYLFVMRTIYICIYIYIHIWCVYIYVYIYIYDVYRCMCVYIYIYMLNTYIYIYVYHVKTRTIHLSMHISILWSIQVYLASGNLTSLRKITMFNFGRPSLNRPC